MEKPLNKKQLQYQKTLESIRLVVDKLVDEVGFENMYIKDICREVGISPGAFYHYFESKNDLLFDRYRRSNADFARFFEEELKGMDTIDAMKAYLVFAFAYIKSRVLGVLIQYSKATLENLEKWHAVESSMPQFLFSQLVEEGLKNGSIKNTYSKEAILAAFSCIFSGAGTAQCTTKGKFLQDDLALQVFLDWIESLRA